MKEIQLDEKQHPTQALIDGQWAKAKDAPEKNTEDDHQAEIDDFTNAEENQADE